MWNLKCEFISVITEATGIVTKVLRKTLEDISGKHSIDSPHNTAILGTSHVKRKVLQSGTWSLSGGDQRWFKRSTRKKRSVTRDNKNMMMMMMVMMIIIIISLLHAKVWNITLYIWAWSNTEQNFYGTFVLKLCLMRVLRGRNPRVTCTLFYSDIYSTCR